MPLKAERESVVLVMERADEDVMLITSTLEKAGFHVFRSSDGVAALNMCRTSDQSAPVVIIDTDTPGIHTSDLLEQLRSINPGIRVILMADDDESVASRNWALAANVRAHLSKPFRRAQLLGSVLKVYKQPLFRTA